jgi:hypothetical protein
LTVHCSTVKRIVSGKGGGVTVDPSPKLDFIYSCDDAQQRVSVMRFSSALGISTMSGFGDDMGKWVEVYKCWRTTAIASANVGRTLRYHPAWRIGSVCACPTSPAPSVIIEKSPSRAEVVRAMIKVSTVSA